MSKSSELVSKSAVELLGLLRSGELRSVELVEALHERADEVEPRVGAFAHQLRARAKEEAAACDAARERGEDLGPLHGLPITIKENIDTEGLPSTLGMRSRRGHVASEDALVVEQLRKAGAVILGKTNVPQTLLAPMESTNAIFGTTHNPWRHGHAPGGSSGGEGAAIAAGMSVAGIGTDIGGSIRGPAAFCGICGIKPTANRWSNLGSNTAIRGQEFVKAQLGPMARTAEDVALLMEALNTRAFSEKDPKVAPAPIGESRAIDVRGLKIAYYEDDGVFTPAASIRRGVREAAQILEDLGATVVRLPPQNAEELAYLYFQGISADGSATLFDALDGEAFVQPLKTIGRLATMPPGARKALGKALGLMGDHRVAKMIGSLGEKTVRNLWEASARRTELRYAELAAWDREGIDVTLAPTYVTPACPIGASHDFTFGFVNFARYSLLDFPAGSVPITRVRPDETNRSGLRDRLDRKAAEIEAASVSLPVGVQVVGRPWREDQTLAVMRALYTEASGREDFPATPVTPR